MNLLDAPGGKYKITKIYAGKIFRNHIRSMGISIGAEIEKLHHEQCIIRSKGATYAIGSGQALKVEVEKIEEVE